MSQDWRMLFLSTQAHIPPLLFKYNTTPQGYEIYVTDLTYIWSEHIGHEEILRRAYEEEASIDPSEDGKQFSVLLRKIEEALDGSKAGSVTVNTGSKQYSLILTTTTKLPAPLQPLEWNLYLSKLPQTELTKRLVLPLLKDGVEYERHERSLLDHLKEKDWVLRKLFDKIEASGLDLSTVFPAAAGFLTVKKGNTLSQVAKYIKGVAPFDEKTWRHGIGDEIAESSATCSTIHPSILRSILDEHNVNPARDKWWESLNGRKAIFDPWQGREMANKIAQLSRTSEIDEKDSDTESGTESDNGRLQRQETPPKFKKMNSEFQQNPQQPNKQSISTDDGFFRELPPTPKYGAQKPAGLGAIGGKKPIENSRTKSISSTASDVSEPSASKTPQMRQETESDEDLSPQRPNTTWKTHKAEETSGRTHSRGLGVIGGSKKAKDQNKPTQFLAPASSVPTSPRRDECISTEDESRSTSLLRNEQTKPRKRIAKLGVIGGNKSNLPTCAPGVAKISIGSGNEQADIAAATAATASVKGKSTTPLSSPPGSAQPQFQPEPDRELTAQEKADKRREELKRQLEAKSKAPIKKKRRF
ncbi:XLF (XRCC4-like factor) domain containing protein [Elaphomyces granulatus]